MAEKPLVKTLEQGRASEAYGYVTGAVKQLGDKAKDYKSYVKKLPVMIKTNGLGQTLAFVKSKRSKDEGKNAYDMIYEQLGDWLRKCPNSVIQSGNDLVKSIIDLDSKDYRVATAEALSLLNWLRRFADGIIEGEGGES
ncbi:MAG: type III-B CRISPR module-associated protein Cmr5 [Actinobacteria bacterium]|nr:type III-B CRISPR module-associated protein Cmr5 [Actinomycetota bacterium]